MDLYYPNLYEKMRPRERLLRCPHCGSLDVSTESCADCGRIFHFDLLGIPLGEHSFFSLSHHFYQLPLAQQRDEKKSYYRNLRRREQVLRHYFQTQQDLHADQMGKSLFQIELSMLRQELETFNIASKQERWHWFWNHYRIYGLLRPLFLVQLLLGFILLNLCVFYLTKISLSL